MAMVRRPPLHAPSASPFGGQPAPIQAIAQCCVTAQFLCYGVPRISRCFVRIALQESIPIPQPGQQLLRGALEEGMEGVGGELA